MIKDLNDLHSFQCSKLRKEDISGVVFHIRKNDNTVASAYYGKMNAQLTDAMGYLVAFKR